MTATPLTDLGDRTPDGDDEPVVSAVAGKSPTRLAYERFRADTKSVVAFWIVVLYVLLAIAAPILVKTGFLEPTKPHTDLLDSNTLAEGKWGGMSWDHPLGIVPGIGWDLMSRVWYGITFSLTIALIASLLAVIIGVVLGIIAGFSGGWTDTLIGRLIDLVLCFPQTLMLLALSTVGIAFLTDTLHVPSGDTAQAVFVITVLAAFGWPGMARLIRGQVLSLREREFIDSAKLLGASRMRLWFKEILPNLWAPIVVNYTLYLPAYISAEAALSYLNVSIKPPTPTLGNILRDSLNYAETAPLFFATPAILIALIVVSFNLLGDGMRDALDPKGNR